VTTYQLQDHKAFPVAPLVIDKNDSGYIGISEIKASKDNTQHPKSTIMILYYKTEPQWNTWLV